MSENKRRTSIGQKDAKASNTLLVGLGVGIVTAVSGLSIAGTVVAINAMNRQSSETIAAAQQTAAAASNASDTSSDTDPAVSETETESVTEAEVSEQVQWMIENGVTYNEHGIPEDADGNLLDDPTTETYDPDREAYFTEETESEDSGSSSVVNPDVETPGTAETESEAETETEPDTEEASVPDEWYYDSDGNLLDGIALDEDGNPYYTVKEGDWLSSIGQKYGFDYEDLAEINDIENPDLIYPEDRIYFSGSSSSVAAGSSSGAEQTTEVINSTAPGLG